MIPAIEAAMTEALGRTVRVTAQRNVGGGCISHASRLETSAGAFFAKWNSDAPGLFEKEAACLDALRGAESGLRIPEVVCWGPRFIVMELLEPGRRVKDFDERFGRGLAALHRTSHQSFGFVVDTFCGRTPQPNPWVDGWIDFYREHRLGHQLALARRAGLFDAGEVRAFERLLDRLPELLIEGAPALIHGDLWSGNLHVTAEGHPALIDPASYYAHREAELGMMTLMGGFSARVYAAYEDAFPLEPGWRERNPLYELYHLINHANLFGGGYVSSTTRIVRRYG